jgi:hypothetical protein
MRSSKAAATLIITEEVNGKTRYEKLYRRPEWPGESSGATIGIGYDLGMTPRVEIIADWKGRVPDEMLAAMLEAQGKTGAAGKKAAAAIRSRVDIPWSTAVAVHEERVIPRWEARLLRALPNADKLPADCFGVLLSIGFNRGMNFTNNPKSGSRREMVAIRKAMVDQDFDAIPALIRSMKRLWPKSKGLRDRREREARLFEKGLKSRDEIVPLMAAPVNDVDAEFKGTTDFSSSNAAEPAPEFATKDRIEKVQRDLASMKYWSGMVDGDLGGRLLGEIRAFDLDWNARKGQPPRANPTIDDQLIVDIDQAIAEKFERPIAPARAEATVADLKPKNETILASWRNKVVSWFVAIGAGLTTIYKGVIEFMGDAWDYLETPREILATVPGWVWGASALGLAIFLGWNSQRAEQDTVEKFRDGRLSS